MGLSGGERGTLSRRVRCLVHPPAAGARNMAVDEALMESARSDGRVTLRFYRWDPPCLSLGRNQTARDRYDPGAAGDRGIDVVRRPTGGRAVFHHREITYSVTAPAGLWGGLRRSYRRLNRALLSGLGRLGARSAGPAGDGGERAPGPSERACFQDPLPGEIVAAGRKLVGSAQWRDRGALLQHGSLLLEDEQAVTGDLRIGGDPAPSGVAAALSEFLDPMPEPEEIVEALRAGFEETLGVSVRDGGLTEAEEERAGALEPRYRDPDWTWRR